MTDRSSAARRARGLRRLDSVWITEDHLSKLDELAEEGGDSRAHVLESLIDVEWEEIQTQKEPAAVKRRARNR